MPRVFIPPQARKLAGCESVEVEAGSVRAIIRQLDQQSPGLADCLLKNGELRPGLSVSVGGRVTGMGLFQQVGPDDEVHFIPAIGGG
ncbi:MAG: MoaD/ThiS family protein [Planctomycetota bacterium]|nr:MoaD/ThiS family protein [Planctomycetota bacterium]MDA1251584.1 MoaD/ThiS family protein [Planctomycetota bacterium]